MKHHHSILDFPGFVMNAIHKTRLSYPIKGTENCTPTQSKRIFWGWVFCPMFWGKKGCCDWTHGQWFSPQRGCWGSQDLEASKNHQIFCWPYYFQRLRFFSLAASCNQEMLLDFANRTDGRFCFTPCVSQEPWWMNHCHSMEHRNAVTGFSTHSVRWYSGGGLASDGR